MKIRILTVVLLFFAHFLLMFEVSGQVFFDPELKSLFAAKDSSHHDHLKPLRESQTEVLMTFSLAFFLYKELISSQDLPKCVFSPSCSEYSIETIQKNGIFVGWLSTFDRLSRCHVFVKKDLYPFDYKNKRFYDPVQ